MTKDDLLDFPPMTNDGLDATIRMHSTYSRVKALSDAQAAAQAAVLKPLISDIICRQVLPAVTYGLFSFHFKSRVQLDPFIASGRIIASCTHPAFKARSEAAWRKVIDIDYGFLTKAAKLNAKHMPIACLDLAVCFRILEALFDDCSTHTAMAIARDVLPAVPGTAAPESSVSLKFKLPTFQAIPDLISWLVCNGYDLTSVQPFLSI